MSGIYKFDGYTFYQYTQDSSKLLIEDAVFPMAIDSDGGLCVVFNDRIAVYDRNRDKFRSFPIPSKNFKQLALGFTGETITWVGSIEQGLLRFDREKKTSTTFLNPSGGGANTIYDIVDEGKTLLLGTADGLWQFDLSENKFYRPANVPESSGIYPGVVKKIFPHRDDYWLWMDSQLIHVGSSGQTINRLDFGEVHERFDLDKKFNDLHVVSVVQDKGGDFWIASQGLGLIYFTPSNNNCINYRKKANDVNSLPSDVLSDVMVDRDQNVWVSTVNKGIVKMRKQSVDFDNYLDGISSTGVALIPGKETSTLFVATNGAGLWRSLFDVNDLSHLNFKPHAFQPAPGFENTLEVAVGKENLWLGSLNAGIVGLPIHQDGVVQNTPGYSYRNDEHNANSLSHNFISALWEDQQGYLWAGTFAGGINITALHSTEPGSAFIHYKHDPADTNSLQDNGVRTFLQQEDGSILVATFGGLDKIEKPVPPYRNLEFQHLLTNVYCNHLYKTRDGSLLVCTKTGLLIGTKVGTAFRFEKIPLPGNPNVTYVEEDLLGRIWCMSFEGLMFYDRQKKFTMVFKKEDGLLSSRSVMAARSWQTPEGIMIFSNGEGLTIFNPLSLTINQSQPRPLITHLKINNEVVSSDENENATYTLPECILTLQNLELDHTQNIIEFKFSAMEMTAPEKNQYKYMLEGFSEHWISTDWKNRNATYTNLRPGDYTFKVMVSNGDGVWSNHVKTLAITVLPPPWATWWAYSIYASIVIGILYWARRSIVKEERLKNSLRIEHVEREKEQLALLKAQEVDRLKSTFFANISHEFRTPLTLIQGPVQILQEKFSADSKVKYQLQLIQNSTNVLLRLINQLLELARLESGNLKVENSRIELNTFLRLMVEYFETQAKQKQLRLSLEVPEIPYVVSVDKGKIETILINLIGNALKFTPVNGRVVIKSYLEKGEDSNASLSIVIRDFGIGIPLDKQEQIFERFYQVNESHKEIGTGIGLALVKELVQLLQGTITVSSKPGEGSEFRVKIPAVILGVDLNPHALEKDTFSEKTIENESSGFEQSERDAHKILVVEDNTELRKFIISAFDSDYYFIEAGTGIEGFEKAVHEMPELIISDIMMPEMDGIAMSNKIKGDVRSSHIPILFLTAKATEESKVEGLETGAEDYLTKPFLRDELVLKVKNIISSRIKIRERLRLEILNEAPEIIAESADEKFIKKVKEIIHERLNDPQLGVDTIAMAIGLSRTQLYRKISALTGISVNELIRSFRLQKAAQLLKQGWGSVSEVAYEVGFSNLSYFTRCFKEEFGVLPSRFAVPK